MTYKGEKIMITPLDILLGRVINNIWLSQDDETLFIATNVGIFRFATDADCCSETWFADIIGTSALLGGKVVSIEFIDFDKELFSLEVTNPARTRQEADDIMGFKITTDKGRGDIIFRNSSNGYYGGSCNDGVKWEGDTSGLKPIIEDYSA